MRVVRPAVEQDLAAVTRLERRIAEAPHWADAEYAVILSGESSGAVRRCLFVGEIEGGVAGFAVGKVIDGGPAELESIAVDGAVRRSGMGRALCRAVMTWCQEQGAAEIELEVRAGSLGAITLYEGLEFCMVGRRAGYYRDPVEDALLMRRELAAAE